MATNDPTTQEIREVANRYLAEFARQDWAGVCTTMAPSERRYYDRHGDSCVNAFRRNAKRVTRRGLKLFRNSRAGEIHLRAEEAVIEVTKLGWFDTILRLYAIQEQDRWWIARSKKRRGS